MSTALQICNSALRKLNIIEPGATAEGNELQAAVDALNLMVASWASSAVHISIAAATSAWQASTYYEAGAQVLNGSNVYTCTGSGTSAASGGPTGTGAGIADGDATWDFYGTEGPVDASLERPLIALLALELAPDFGIEPAPSLQKQAADGWNAVLAYYVAAPNAGLDSGLLALPSQHRVGV